MTLPRKAPPNQRLKILLSSHLFHPSVGGIESISMLLAESFARRGHEVRVVTQTPSDQPDSYPFEVCRKPSAREAFDAIRWSDIVFHSNITLRNIWPLILLRRPWVVTHQTWIARGDGSQMWMDRVKRLLLNAARCISISKAVAESVPTPSVIIPNSYDNDNFRLYSDVKRERDFVFMGRLVSDKGADLLLEASAQLRKKGLKSSVTIVGGGPEMEALQRQASESGIADQVRFTGPLRGEELARELNKHRIMVVPSRWNEPFGIVALEGLGCGCVAVGSKGGGLADAIGKCGPTFNNNDAQGLADILENLLRNPSLLDRYKQHVEKHLTTHRPLFIVEEYMRAFRLALGQRESVI